MKTRKIITIGMALAVLLQLNIIVNEVKAEDTPTITFVGADFANTLSVHTVSSSDVLWSDIEISGICDTSHLGTYVTPGDAIFGCYGVITLTYFPTHVVLCNWPFSPGPDITFSMNDSDNTLTITSVGVPDVFWWEIGISGNCTTYSLGYYITPGDQITDCYDTISLTFNPTNTFLGEWEFSPPPSNGQIYGTVLGIYVNGEQTPLEDVDISAIKLPDWWSFSGHTDQNGYYSISVPPGNYLIVADAHSFTFPIGRINTTVGDGENVEVNFNLNEIVPPDPPVYGYGWLHGTVRGVLEDGDQIRLQNVKVELISNTNTVIMTDYTNEYGMYSFEIEPGKYSVRAHYSGFSTKTISDVYVESEENTMVDFLLFEGIDIDPGWLQGTIYQKINGINTPLALASIQLRSESGELYEAYYSDNNGFYSIIAVPGVYSVNVYKDGFTSIMPGLTSYTGDIRIIPNNVTEMDYVLYEKTDNVLGEIFGTVYQTSDNVSIPLSNATISYHLYENVESNVIRFWDVEFADKNGNYSLKLQPATYEIRADNGEASVSESEIVEVKANQKIRLDLTIPEETISDDPSVISEILVGNAIKKGNVGGKINIWNENNNYEHEIIIYNSVIISELNIEKNKVSFIVNGKENNTGKTIAINVDSSVFNQDLKILVEYDGQPMKMADDISDVLNPNDDGSYPEYLIVLGSNGAQLLVSIPHFSEHTIEFFVQQVAQYLVYAVIVAVVLVIIAAVVMFRKGKED